MTLKGKFNYINPSIQWLNNSTASSLYICILVSIWYSLFNISGIFDIENIITYIVSIKDKMFSKNSLIKSIIQISNDINIMYSCILQ